jgi:DNA-binding CsgD family transcriptional regulator
MGVSGDYEIFRKFTDRYLPSAFRDIARGSSFMKEMESILRERKQFFYAGDLLEMRIDFTSQGIYEILGLRPENFNVSTIIRATHPVDMSRLRNFPPRFRRTGMDLFNQKGGEEFLSVSTRFLRPDGHILPVMAQSWAFYSSKPYESVFAIVIYTDISHLSVPRLVQHHYVGRDPSFFRYPDDALLKTGHSLSDKELEILSLVACGMESEQIAQKLTRSVHTVNTHRRNILRKTGRANVQELILHLKDQGML